MKMPLMYKMMGCKHWGVKGKANYMDSLNLR